MSEDNKPIITPLRCHVCGRDINEESAPQALGSDDEVVIVCSDECAQGWEEASQTTKPSGGST